MFLGDICIGLSDIYDAAHIQRISRGTASFFRAKLEMFIFCFNLTRVWHKFCALINRINVIVTTDCQ